MVCTGRGRQCRRLIGGSRPLSRVVFPPRACARQIFTDNTFSRAYITRIMPKSFPFLTAAALSLCAALAFAQEAPSTEKALESAKPEPTSKAEGMTLAQNITTPRPKPKPTATPAVEAPVAEVVATPKPKKPGFFKRLFGPREPKGGVTPTPAATATPTATPRKTTRTANSTLEPAKTNPTVVTKQDMPVVAAPAPARTTPKPGATPAPGKSTTKPKAAAEPAADVDPETQEKLRFDQAKAKAMEDPQVSALKAKADNASTEAESSKALRAYNKALFEKIRKIDKSVAERATRLEAAILKRLSE